MEFTRFTLAALLIVEILLPISILGLNDCNFPAIFNFGDSNSDTGGRSALSGQVPLPYGETFFHAPAGRYSDGRLIIDFMAESLGLPYLSAFLDSIGSNFSHGANFATAASTIRPNVNLGFSPVSLAVQQVQYSDFLRRSQIVRRKQGFFRNLLPEEDYFSRALYTIDIGQNDLTAGYDLNLTPEQVKALVPDILRQFSNAIKQLYSQGARSFWVHNTAPGGCLTYLLDRFLATETRVDKSGCLISLNNVSQYFNLRLKETVLQLRKELPQAAITYVDIYSVKYTLISQAKKLGRFSFLDCESICAEQSCEISCYITALFCNKMTGFENPFIVCCGSGGRFNHAVGCGSKGVVNGTEIVAGSCRDPSVRINWDGVHLTEAANKWIFDQIVNGSFSDPPLPLKSACNKMKS